MRHWSYSRFSKKGDAPGQEHWMDIILTNSWQPPSWAGSSVVKNQPPSPYSYIFLGVLKFFIPVHNLFTPLSLLLLSTQENICLPYIAVGAYPRPLTSLWSKGTLTEYKLHFQFWFLCNFESEPISVQWDLRRIGRYTALISLTQPKNTNCCM